MTWREHSLAVPRAAVEDVVEQDVWQWFENIEEELRLLDLSEDERHLLEGYYASAGLLKQWRRAFFRHHYSLPLLRSTQALFARTSAPKVLDLGCGMGTQALWLAVLGARVVGADMDERALGILKKRKALYEERVGKRLQIELVQGNVFELDFDLHAPFDGVYSLFAFNMMQPAGELLNKLAPHLAGSAVVAIQEGNRDHFYNRFFRQRFASRRELRTWLRNLGFHEFNHIGGYAIPPPVWTVLPRWLLEPIDRRLTRFNVLAASYVHIATRNQTLL